MEDHNNDGKGERARDFEGGVKNDAIKGHKRLERSAVGIQWDVGAEVGDICEGVGLW